MARDPVAFTADDLPPAVRAADTRDRLAILHHLSGAGAGASQIAEQLGLSRESVDRHLMVLQNRGLVAVAPDRTNGPIYTLDGEKAAALRTRFVSTDTASTSAPPSPEACTQCENGPFVRDVLGDLDRALENTRQYQDRVRLMSLQILTAQEEERKRIARELHDETAQALTSVLVRLRVLERSVDDAEIRAGLSELREQTRTTLDGVRRMSVDLRPQALDDRGLEAALEAHVQDFSERWPIKATFGGGAVSPLPPDVELVLYRVAQEALANVARHSGACRVQVRLTHDADTLRLLVEDDGRGFDVRDAKASPESGLGLFGMEERLVLIGGALRIESTVGGGTRVVAEVPLPRSDRG